MVHTLQQDGFVDLAAQEMRDVRMHHSNVADTGLLYSLNFAVSHDRNILVAIVFYITAGCFSELFATGFLLVLAVVAVIRDREFFLRRSYAGPHSDQPGVPVAV